MIEYLDGNGKKLEKGFYKPVNLQDLVYFTGRYGEEGLPIFDTRNEGENLSSQLDTHLVRRLVRFSKETIHDKIKELKKQTNWLEEKLKN